MRALRALHGRPGAHSSRDVIDATVRLALPQLHPPQHSNPVLPQQVHVAQRRHELSRASEELDRLKAEIARKRAQPLGLSGAHSAGDGGEQPTMPVPPRPRKGETRTLSVPLHTSQAAIHQPRGGRLGRGPTFQLYNEQLTMESLALDEAVQHYAEVTNTVVGLQKGAQLAPAQRMMLTWYSPLVAAVEAQQTRGRELKDRKARTDEQHLAYLLHLSAPQLAVLTMHTMFSLALAWDRRESRPGVRFTAAAGQLGLAVNMEVKMELMRKHRHKLRHFLASIVAAEAGGAGGASGAAGSTVLSRLRSSKNNQWSEEVCVKVGAALLQLLLATASVPDAPRGVFTPAFRHELQWELSNSSRGVRQVGVIITDERVLSVVLHDRGATDALMPKLKPMIVPPRPWTSYEEGGYLSVVSRVMRNHGSIMQLAAVSRSDLATVYRGLNVLSAVPWRINGRVLSVIDALWEAGGGVADLPSLTDVPVPAIPPDADSTSRKAAQREASAVQRHNRNLHSLRCDAHLKLTVARQFKGRELYFPFNVDFRGRAYPIPPHLNHLGNDLCRGLLLFAERRKLGEEGVRWLHIHTTNVWGHGLEKRPYDERAQWCTDHLDAIRQAAATPVPRDSPTAEAWWLQAEKPFQFLAACFELDAAYRGGDPAEYASALPVHQDGSCNGLQHYAALGRDEEGGAAVNLTPSDRPQDVYSVVCASVLRRVAEDAAAGSASAQLLDGRVTRKIVKQTVMTSVYGVTLIGAKEQVQARLLETAIAWPPPAEASVAAAALYLAKVTLASLFSAFQGARRIQEWLSECAARMSAQQQPVSWVTPLGLPVIQPYRRAASYSVHTIMQQVNLAAHSDLLPVSSARQRSAFPPNFIHSLDATHMLMTALRCEEEGLVFSAVHDSYWTHAGDMGTMGRLLREEFVRLYEQPILQRLKDEWEKRFPEIDFPPVPDVGALDLQKVRDSPYFFN